MRLKLIFIIVGLITLLIKMYLKKDEKIFNGAFSRLFSFYSYIVITLGVIALIQLIKDFL